MLMHLIALWNRITSITENISCKWYTLTWCKTSETNSSIVSDSTVCGQAGLGQFSLFSNCVTQSHTKPGRQWHLRPFGEIMLPPSRNTITSYCCGYSVFWVIILSKMRLPWKRLAVGVEKTLNNLFVLLLWQQTNSPKFWILKRIKFIISDVCVDWSSSHQRVFPGVSRVSIRWRWGRAIWKLNWAFSDSVAIHCPLLPSSMDFFPLHCFTCLHNKVISG